MKKFIFTSTIVCLVLCAIVHHFNGCQMKYRQERINLVDNSKLYLSEYETNSVMTDIQLTGNMDEKGPSDASAPNRNQYEKYDSKEKKFLVYTRYRSGSSFVGEMLKNHPDIHYMFEPLHLISLQKKVRENQFA